MDIGFSNFRSQLSLGLKQNFRLRIFLENFGENFFSKINENWGKVNDVDYLGNGA
jgi:hypothetical protein